MRLEDLPPHLQRQALAKAGQDASKRTTHRKAAGVHRTVCACGETFLSYGRWEKHSDREGRGHRTCRLDMEEQ